MTIYLDLVFAENLIVNYIILIATGIINKTKIKHTNIIIACIIGAIYTVVVYLKWENLSNSFFSKLVLSFVMIYIAFLPKKIKTFFKQLLIFYLTTFSFGGVTLFLINTLGRNNNKMKIILLGVSVGTLIICLSFKLIRNGVNKKNMICELEVLFDGKSKKIKAMIDSGNLLREPITNIPVVVIQKDNLLGIIPNGILDNVENILKGEIMQNENNSQYISKLRVIPFLSVGKENGMLLGIKINQLIIYLDEEIKKVDDVIIGIYNGTLSRTGQYCGLIGLELIEK